MRTTTPLVEPVIALMGITAAIAGGVLVAGELVGPGQSREILTYLSFGLIQFGVPLIAYLFSPFRP